MFGKIELNTEQFWCGKHCALRTGWKPPTLPRASQRDARWHFSTMWLWEFHSNAKTKDKFWLHLAHFWSSCSAWIWCVENQSILCWVSLISHSEVTAIFFHLPPVVYKVCWSARFSQRKPFFSSSECHLVPASAGNYQMPPSSFERAYSQWKCQSISRELTWQSDISYLCLPKKTK